MDSIHSVVGSTRAFSDQQRGSKAKLRQAYERLFQACGTMLDELLILFPNYQNPYSNPKMNQETQAGLIDCEFHNNETEGLLVYDEGTCNIYGEDTISYDNKSHGLSCVIQGKINIFLSKLFCRKNLTRNNLKILLNHLHLIALAGSLPLRWPLDLRNFYAAFSVLTRYGSFIFAPDCDITIKEYNSMDGISSNIG